MSGRDGSRWGPSKRNEGGRPERGYAVNDRNTRRRDDRNYGYRDDDYYGRGYEQTSRGDDGRYEQSRPRSSDRETHWARRDDRRDPRSRYPDDRKDKGQWSRYSDEREWQCMECGISNYDADERCARCGSISHLRDHRSMSNADESEPPQGPKWPPPFESGGASYAFHAASGMFYEAIADFYYDPKSKLYFGNKSKKYYTYRHEEDPPFCEFDAPPTFNETDVTVDTAGLKLENKKKIAISLKTTVLPASSKANKKPKPHKAPKKVKAPPPEPKKKDAVNIEVWAERGKEIREESASAKIPQQMTTKPVCLLCRRKFATVEKLKKHEELSDLHKENLKKKEGEANREKQEESGMEYRDRALERRIMHRPAEAVSFPALPRDLEETATTRVAEVVRPEESLGESNIGNVLLQKLGWKSGSSIGRPANGEQDTAQNTLVKDWEKIESLAASGQQDYAKQKSRESGIGN